MITKYLNTRHFCDTLISRFRGSHNSRHLNFVILRKFYILTHFNFAFFERDTLFLWQWYLTCPWIWSNNLINNIQIKKTELTVYTVTRKMFSQCLQGTVYSSCMLKMIVTNVCNGIWSRFLPHGMYIIPWGIVMVGCHSIPVNN